MLEGGAGFSQQSSASPRDRDASGDEKRLGEETGANRAPFSAPPVYQVLAPTVRVYAMRGSTPTVSGTICF